MKKAELMQLVAAGFSRNEILALEQVEDKKEPSSPAQKPTEDKPADVRAMDQLVTAITALQKEVAELKKAPVEQEQKTREDGAKYSDNDVLKLLQKVNTESHAYDAPPKYDVEDSLAAAYVAMVGGTMDKEEKNNE